MLHDGIFFAICLTALEKKIHCKSQQTRYTLQSRATICNGFRKSPQSLQKVERELYDKMKYEDLGYITDRVNTVVFNYYLCQTKDRNFFFWGGGGGGRGETR